MIGCGTRLRCQESGAQWRVISPTGGRGAGGRVMGCIQTRSAGHCPALLCAVHGGSLRLSRESHRLSESASAPDRTANDFRPTVRPTLWWDVAAGQSARYPHTTPPWHLEEPGSDPDLRETSWRRCPHSALIMCEHLPRHTSGFSLTRRSRHSARMRALC